MHYLRIILTAGFAIFSMFFGSGNIVFPLLAGVKSSSDYGMATLGIVITTVVVPLIGLLGLVLYDGKREHYFAPLGKHFAFLLTLMIILLIGPLGVIPRCITVAYGGLAALTNTVPLYLFSFLFSLVIMALIWKPNKVVDIIGVVLTPFKLGGIALLILAGILFGDSQNIIPSVTSTPLTDGLLTGYQTMDLMASFFFSTAIVMYLKNNLNDPKQIFKGGIISCLIGSLILVIIFAGFVKLGTLYASQLQEFPPEQYFAKIAGLALGEYATYVFSFTIIVACLATAVILSAVFVDFLKRDLAYVLHKDEYWISNKTAIFITVISSFLISLLGFSQITKFLGLVLTYTYPALITYAVCMILTKFWLNKRVASIGFWITLLGTVAYNLFVA